MNRAYLNWIGWSVIMLFALWLRIDGLEVRPIHADEATGARILAERLEGNGYNFDPKHFHGPTLSLIAQPIAKLAGEDSWQSLSTQTLRIGVVFAGLLTVASALLWVRTIGATAALVAGALLATSPLLVYYNRMFIHESWLVLFGLLALNAIYRLLSRPTLTHSLLAGLFVGLMFATKETFVISICSWSLAALSYLGCHYLIDGKKANIAGYVKLTIAGGIISFVVGAILLTSWFAQPKAIVDAIQTYFVYETTPGHEKPLLYYLEYLIWPKQSLGIWWSEGLVFILGLAAVATCVKKRRHFPVMLFIGLATIAHVAIYSLIGYKTPWLMLLPWSHACLLAALAFSSFTEYTKLAKGALLSFLLVGLVFQAKQSIHATGSFSNDTRNPYAYVPTSKDPVRLQSWLSELKATPGVESLEPISVVGNGYWPLPWYLRDFETIGYWPSPNADLTNSPLVISMPSESIVSTELLESTHIALPRGLRENFSITVFLRNDLWEIWNETDDE